MSHPVQRYRATWPLPVTDALEVDDVPAAEPPSTVSRPRELILVEPTIEEVKAASAQLSEHYNEPTNRRLMTNESEMTADDVVAMYRTTWSEGGRGFFFRVDRSLVGDCDLRRLDPQRRTAEIAILIGPRHLQGRGLGTRFNVMVLAVAFGPLRLERVYAAVGPDNSRSIHMFERVGYVRDASAEARRYAERDDEVCFSMDAARYRDAQGHAARQIRVGTGAYVCDPNARATEVADGCLPYRA